MITTKQLTIAALRLAIGASTIATAHILPDLLAWVAKTGGTMFVFIAAYGLIAPFENAVTGRVADWLTNDAPPFQPYATSLDSYTDEIMAATKQP